MKRKLAALICATMAVCFAFGAFTGCTKKIDNETTALAIMSEELDGVFNPFFYTAGPDGEIVGMTQLGMLTSNDSGEIVAGENEATVALAWQKENFPNRGTDPNGETVYTFVIKNGVKFSDGVPLSIRDVLFNLYVYLDPVYTGSSTIYSTAIKGLSEYRTGSTDANADIALTQAATVAANSRRNNLINAVNTIKRNADDADNVNDDYILERLSTEDFKTDYKLVMNEFRDELATDYRNSKEAYKDAPYNFTDVEGFMYNENIVIWDKKLNDGVGAVKEWGYPRETIKTEEAAINYVYDRYMPRDFESVVSYWGTAVDVMEKFTAEAKQKILVDRGGVSNIEGIVALDGKDVSSVKVNGVDYQVAKLPHGHQEDGSYTDWGDFNSDWSVKDGDKYQVLQITINGIDPKAEFNFSFSVAPLHYYSSDKLTKDFSIDDDNFGVVRGDINFMDGTINHVSKVALPVGAGPYKATDRNGSDNPSSAGFKDGTIVRFKRNDHFLLGKPVIKYVNYKVISQAQAINSVKSGEVHYAMPQSTTQNLVEIEAAKKSVGYLSNQQNGYGYIGINAGKIPNRYLRYAIATACDIELATEYYGTHAKLLYWSMSKESWAYPRIGDTYKDVKADYAYEKVADKTDPEADYKNGVAAQERIRKYMAQAGVNTQPTGKTTTEGLPQYEIISTIGSRTVDLNYTFTIAGANLTEHPTYSTLREAARLLNSCGWSVRVDPDLQALSKLASGSLTVWAAAWSATIDPDMYQVYHRNSTATSTYTWGYREMRNGAPSGKVSIPVSTLTEDWNTVARLSSVIEEARKSDKKAVRTPLYEEALGYVRDLAVEIPVYQRENIYLYSKKYVDESTLNHSTSAFTNPLSRIWEVSLNVK